VYGLAASGSGSTYGGYFQTLTPAGVGVTGFAPSTGLNFGVTGRSDSTTGFGMNSSGDLRVQGDFIVTGAKTGYVCDLVKNGGAEPLECGDVVEIIGSDQAINGDIPVIVVQKTQSTDSHAVLGPVDCAVMLNPVEELSGETKLPARLRYSTPQFYVHKTNGVISPGGYGRVVTLGSYKMIKVDATFGAILPGDLLVSSPNSGYAMASDNPKIGAVIGKSLGTLSQGSGVIPVLIQSR
jgi:hypothetical protein